MEHNTWLDLTGVSKAMASLKQYLWWTPYRSEANLVQFWTN